MADLMLLSLQSRRLTRAPRIYGSSRLIWMFITICAVCSIISCTIALCISTGFAGLVVHHFLVGQNVNFTVRSYGGQTSATAYFLPSGLMKNESSASGGMTHTGIS